MLDQVTQAAGGIEALPRPSDTTESVYSSGPTPRASPKQDLTRLNTERLHPDPAVGSLSPPSPVPDPTPIQQTPAYTQRDLQRQQEVRDRLSGKPEGELADRDVLRRRSGRRPAVKALRASLLVLPHNSSHLSRPRWWRKKPCRCHLHYLCSPTCHFPFLDFPGMEQEHEPERDGEDYVEPPNFDFDHGRDSPFRYGHGAPSHNVVEKEEEEYSA